MVTAAPVGEKGAVVICTLPLEALADVFGTKNVFGINYASVKSGITFEAFPKFVSEVNLAKFWVQTTMARIDNPRLFSNLVTREIYRKVMNVPVLGSAAVKGRVISRLEWRERPVEGFLPGTIVGITHSLVGLCFDDGSEKWVEMNKDGINFKAGREGKCYTETSEVREGVTWPEAEALAWKNKGEYHMVERNCHHFAKDFYNSIARDPHNDYPSQCFERFYAFLLQNRFPIVIASGGSMSSHYASMSANSASESMSANSASESMSANSASESIYARFSCYKKCDSLACTLPLLANLNPHLIGPCSPDALRREILCTSKGVWYSVADSLAFTLVNATSREPKACLIRSFVTRLGKYGDRALCELVVAAVREAIRGNLVERLAKGGNKVIGPPIHEM